MMHSSAVLQQTSVRESGNHLPSWVIILRVRQDVKLQRWQVKCMPIFMHCERRRTMELLLAWVFMPCPDSSHTTVKRKYHQCNGFQR